MEHGYEKVKENATFHVRASFNMVTGACSASAHSWLSAYIIKHFRAFLPPFAELFILCG
jgi:hypothetical protein